MNIHLYTKTVLFIISLSFVPGFVFAQIPVQGVKNAGHETGLYESWSAPGNGFLKIHKGNMVTFERFKPFDSSFQDPQSEKSPVIAALLSGLLPGAGQWYSGYKTKALAFLAVEASFWFGNSYYKDQGSKIEEEFRRYADQYWNKADYFGWANSPEVNISRYSHTLPGTKTQQYYEMIGKYDQFLAGWPDSNGDPDESEMRLNYMSRQHESNKLFKRAERFAQLLVLNRITSAAEAAFALREKSSDFSANLRWANLPGNKNATPVISIAYVW